MTQRIRFIEKIRISLHKNADKVIDSLYGSSHSETKTLISSFKVELDRLQNQAKKDD